MAKKFMHIKGPIASGASVVKPGDQVYSIPDAVAARMMKGEQVGIEGDMMFADLRGKYTIDSSGRILRTSTLADGFIAGVGNREHPQIVQPRVVDAVRARAAGAKKLMLTAEAAFRAGELTGSVTDLIIREGSFARAPFDVTWIELPFAQYLKGFARAVAPDCAPRVAFLIDHDRAYTVSGNGSNSATLAPFAYDIHSPASLEDEIRFCEAVGCSRLSLNTFTWGSNFDDLATAEDQRALRLQNTIRILPLVVETRELGVLRKPLGTTIMEEYNGTLRDTIALMLLLSRPNLIKYVEDVQRSFHFHRGKRRQYYSHSTISFPLTPKETIVHLRESAGHGEDRARHGVKGHWCQNQEARDYATIAGCVHQWERAFDFGDPKERDRFKCRVCGGKRWWRSAHMRGSAVEGFVRQEYQVT